MRCNAARTIISSHGHPWYPQPCPRSDPAFTVSHLKNGSPATVSRAGVLFLNEADVGWLVADTDPRDMASGPGQAMLIAGVKEEDSLQCPQDAGQQW